MDCPSGESSVSEMRGSELGGGGPGGSERKFGRPCVVMTTAFVPCGPPAGVFFLVVFNYACSGEKPHESTLE